MNRNKSEDKYIVTTFKDGKLTQKIVSFNELNNIKQNETDLFVNESNREVSFKSQVGKRLYYNGVRIPGVGTYEWCLLLDILWAVGEWIPLDSRGHINARVHRLRKAFDGSKKESCFFQTCRNPIYSIRWNPGKSWRFVEKKAAAFQ